MKKTLLFSFIAAAAAVSAAPTDAQALDTCNVGIVTLLNGAYPVPLGTWRPELLNYSDYNGPEVCTYFVKWVNAGFALANTSNLFLDEFIIPAFADCELNSVNSVPTALCDSPDYDSVGFNKFGVKFPIQSIMLQSDGHRHMFGIIWFGTHFPYHIEVDGL